jgi:cell division protein FtsB
MQRFGFFNKTKDYKSDKLGSRLFNVVLVFSLVLFLASAVRTSGKIKKINKEITERENKLTELKKEEEEMKKKYEQVTSPEYMEKQLRNQLNMSKENEIILVLPQDEILKKLVPPDEEERSIDTTPNYRKWAELFGVLK